MAAPLPLVSGSAVVRHRALTKPNCQKAKV